MKHFTFISSVHSAFFYMKKGNVRFDTWIFLASIWILCWMLLALLAPIIANNKPLYCIINGQAYFPVFESTNNQIQTNRESESAIYIPGIGKSWKDLAYDYVIWPIIPYNGNVSSNIVFSQPPFTIQYKKFSGGQQVPLSFGEQHWLGSTHDGRDLLAALIYGSRTALFFSISIIILSVILGIGMGGIAGYFGDRHISMDRGSIIFLIVGLILAYYYGWYLRSYVMYDAIQLSSSTFLYHVCLSILITILCIALMIMIARGLQFLPIFNKKVYLPVDQFILRIIETIRSIPIFILLLTMGVIFNHQIGYFILSISCLSWVGYARLVRGEIMRIKRLEFIDANRLMGFSSIYILFRHIVPNVMPVLWVSVFLGIGNMVLAESALSFLNVGFPPGTPSWGKLISSAKQLNMSLWWVAIFPGVVLTLTVLSFNLWGEKFRDLADPVQFKENNH